MLNKRGGIECDLTVSRLAEDTYYIVTGTGFATHDFAWIKANIRDGLDARPIDVTSAYAVLSLMGPRAREVLAAVADGDMSNAAFPFGTWREVMIAGAPVRALRVTYVGELGWELHLPVEAAGAATTPSWRLVGRTVLPTPAIAPLNRCGSRRAIAPGGRTSVPITRHSKEEWPGR